MRTRAVQLMSVAALAAFFATGAIAGTQQDKMTTCNKDASAKNLSGDARKAFMSECLKNKPAAPAAPMTQQEKMTACNKDASSKHLAGDARKTFMSDCLKKAPAAGAAPATAHS